MYLKYNLYLTLLGEASEYADVDLYIAERGWQDWMNGYEPEAIVKILRVIFTLSKMSLSEMRQSSGLSRPQFSRKYNIPIRSVENWDSGARNAPSYIFQLISYTFFEELINKV